tara:strand:+ start:296 stop:475 length:180 start_codon:yes stop_codon:yes gene_type:complete
MKSKWHNISIQHKSFEELENIQRQLPIQVSIPKVIEWLISVGTKQMKSVTNEEKDKMQR